MTIAESNGLFPKYRNRGLFIDAKLLLLYLVGGVDPQLVSRFKRTQGFEAKDFFLLKAIADFFSNLVTSPGVLTEVSNLAGQLSGERRSKFFALFSERIQVMQEVYVPSVEAVRVGICQRLGLTDAAIILACKDRYLAITADYPLTRFMEDNQLDVINFNHLRSLDWN